MTTTLKQDEIIEMARQVWLSDYGSKVMLGGEDVEINLEDLEAFVKLVTEKAHEEFGLPAVGILERTVARAVAKEREACAKVCEWYSNSKRANINYSEECAQAIRARAQADGAKAERGEA